MEPFLNKESRSSFALVLVFVFLTTSIVSSGYFYYRNYEKNFRVKVEQELSAIAELKVSEIVHWRKERLGDAAVFYKNNNFSARVRQYLKTPGDEEAQTRLRTWLSIFQATNEYNRVFLLDTSGAGRMSVPSTPEPVAPHFLEDVQKILRPGQVAFLDFHRDIPNCPMTLGVAVPIFDYQQDSRPLGILILRIDPAKYLYPMINRWPTPSKTAETLIVRRDGNDALFLNELRFQKNAALNLRIPMEKTQTPAVKAVLGQKGIVEGTDYRGESVIADVRPIPDSPWFMVTRMDISEVYAPVRERLWLIIILIGSLLLGTGAGVGLIWRHQRTQYYHERYDAAEALQESEKKYRMIAENTNDFIWILDLESMQVTYASPSVKKITGYTVEEYLNRAVEEILTSQSLMLAMDVLSEGLKRNANRKGNEDITDRTEWQQFHKNGHTIWMEVETNFIRDDHGKPIGVIGVSRDISERKKAEEEKTKLEALLQQSQKMESLGTLAGGVAHEFNNILAVIIGNTELAFDDVPESNPARKCLKEILSASLRAKDVVRQILGFARKSVFQLMPVQISPIISETLKLIRASVPKTIEIRQDLSCTSGTVMADSTQIKQVLINLCDNAKKAMQAQGGVLEVKLEDTLLDEKNARSYENLSPGNYLKLTVRDTGHGIDPKIMDRIFDPYFTTSSMADASGMGLAVVYGIVKHHNGAISVASEPGKVSVFEVLFPVARNEAKAEKEKAPALPGGNEQILLIDDDASLVKMVKRMLELHGYQVETKSDPVEALDMVRSEPGRFDLIITDMTMPKMTGDKLAKEILSIRPDMPVILCSGFNENIDADKARALGIRRYIEKPLNMSDFVATVRSVLDESKGDD